MTCLAILFLCLGVRCVEFWLTEDNFRSLLGGQSAAADVTWQLDHAHRYLHSLAAQLTAELGRVKVMCDGEVDALTGVFFSTFAMQTATFTSTLRHVCTEAKGANCARLAASEAPRGGRIVGCKFLPLQASRFTSMSMEHMTQVVAREVEPLLAKSRRMLAAASCLVVLLLCLRLVLTSLASTVRHYLLLAGKLPRVRVYQAEENNQTLGHPSSMHSHVLRRSQSWVDSCESGVYVGEGEGGGEGDTGR